MSAILDGTSVDVRDPRRAGEVPVRQSSMPTFTAQRVAEFTDSATAVTIKKLSDTYDDDPGQTTKGFVGEELARFEDENVAELAQLVGRLPGAEQMRCHLPRYSLLFTGPGQSDLEVALCFRCNNARVRVGDDLGWFTFDGASNQADELLSRLRVADPDPAPVADS